jgi:hypothetical protein
MAAKSTSSTVRSLHAAKRVAAKTTTAKSAGGAKKTASKKPVSRSTDEKSALDVLRLFVKTYANL